MKSLKIIPVIFLLFGIYSFRNSVHAEVKNPKEYKVLSSSNKKLSLANVEYYLEEGDKFLNKGDFQKSKDSYLSARELSTRLASYYSDLNKAFIGKDARIPNEMAKKGKGSLQILAESNSRLAALYIRDGEPEVAVPLLIENIRIMSPDSPEGENAYETLIQLGFVETTYKR